MSTLAQLNQQAGRAHAEKLRSELAALRAALQNTTDALADFYLVNGRNPSATYNTVQIILDARRALNIAKADAGSLTALRTDDARKVQS